MFVKDLLLLQSVIRTPASTDIDILVRQATRSTMRETLKEIDKRGFTNIFVHLSVDDTYHLLKAVSSAINAAFVLSPKLSNNAVGELIWNLFAMSAHL